MTVLSAAVPIEHRDGARHQRNSPREDQCINHRRSLLRHNPTGYKRQPDCNSSHQQNQGKRALTDELSRHQRTCHKIRELSQRRATLSVVSCPIVTSSPRPQRNSHAHRRMGDPWRFRSDRLLGAESAIFPHRARYNPRTPRDVPSAWQPFWRIRNRRTGRRARDRHGLRSRCSRPV